MNLHVRRLVDWKRLLVAIPIFVVIGGAVYLVRENSTPSADTPRAALADTPPGMVEKIGVQKGQLARDFVGTAPDGSIVRLSELRGRPTIINFWATWCGSCLAELPDFKAVQEEVGIDNLYVVAVNTGEDASTAQEWIDELGIQAFHVALDPTLVVSDAYGVFGMPTSLFLDADGVIRATYVGHLSKEQMREYLAAAQASSDAGEPPSKLRLITTVARERTLEYIERGDGTVELRSKSLRCDETYCAEDAVAAFSETDGVRSIDRSLSSDPPSITVDYDPDVATPRAMAEALAAALNELGDPLYERPLEIIEAED